MCVKTRQRVKSSFTKAAPRDYICMGDEQVLTHGPCLSFQICQFSGFKQTP